MYWKTIYIPYQRLASFFTKPYAEKYFIFFFRITIALIALVELASFQKDFSFFFSASNTLIPQELMYMQSDYFMYLYPLNQFLKQNGYLNEFYTLSVPLYITALIFLLIGFLTRYTAILALLLQLLIYRSFSHFNYGYDYFMTMSLFYCVVFPVGKYYAIDHTIFKKRTKQTIFNYQRLLQIHLTIAYFFSGIAKALDAGWWNGNSVWNAITSVDNYSSYYPPILYITAGFMTLFVEITYPLFMYLKTTRKWMLIAIISMHVGIGWMMNLYAFSAIMIVWNIASFGSLKSHDTTV